MRLSGHAKLAGVIGWPVSHSRSPALHNFWLQKYGIDGVYVPLPVAPGQLETAVCGLRAAGFAGVNITVPHKQAAAALCDSLDRSARTTGSANILVFSEADGIVGSSSDGAGFIANLRRHGVDPASGPAMVLGAGGAALAIAASLLECGAQVRLTNRTAAHAQALAGVLPAVSLVDWASWTAALPGCSLLVNATSLGMAGSGALQADLSAAPPDMVVADIVYTPRVTPLLAHARRRGLRTVEGIGMLLHQAVPAFAAWFGVTPAIDEEAIGVLTTSS